jgi:hypothetical protein
MHRVTQCRASRDYRLWLKFADGLEGSVYLGDLLDIRAFRPWLDVERFCRAAIDPADLAVVWEGGIRFDPDILHQQLASEQSNRFMAAGLAPAA